MDKLVAKEEVEEEVTLKFWDNADEIYQVQGFWYLTALKDATDAFRSQFQSRSDDVLLTSFIKTGATWLMALCHSILHQEDEDALAKKNPHELVPTLEASFLLDPVQRMLQLDPPSSGRRRLLHTHLALGHLPGSVAESGCKVVYVARNPKDTLVSMWHFCNKLYSKAVPLERAVDCFCSGALPWGPFYEHLVGYWEESKRRPQEVLFLKYEDLIREPKVQLRKLASFIGKPFSPDDDGEAAVEKVLWRSSLERLRELDVNKNGRLMEVIQVTNDIFFRRGTVGDWKNYLTPEMALQIDQLTRSKLHGTGLSLDD